MQLIGSLVTVAGRDPDSLWIVERIIPTPPECRDGLSPWVSLRLFSLAGELCPPDAQGAIASIRQLQVVQAADPIRVGDRVMEFPRLISQQCGTVVRFAPRADRPGTFPVVCWDSGYTSFSSSEYGLTRMQAGQLSLPLFGAN